MTSARRGERLYKSINVVFGAVTRAAPNRAQTRAASAIRLRPVDSLERELDQKRHRSQSADRHQCDCGGLSHRPFNFIGDQHSNAEPKRGAREREQIIQRSLLGRFWKGYREGHRLLLYVSFIEKKREKTRTRVLRAICSL